MKDKVVTTEDYQNAGKAINLSGFTNIEKSMTETEFNYLMKQGKHEVYTKNGLTAYLTTLSTNLDTIEKAEGSEVSAKDTIEKAKTEIASLKVIPVVNKNGALTRYYVREKSADEIQKGIDSVMYNQTFKSKKKGSEIKEKVTALRTKIAAKILSSQEEIDELEEKIGTNPTEGLSSYYTEDLAVETKLPKLYHYQMTYYNSNTDAGGAVYSEESKVSTTTVSSAEAAKWCSEHNELVYCLARCLKDLKKIDIFIESLTDSKEYELSVNDLVDLGF